MALPLPRFVVARPLAKGATGFYWVVPTYYRRLGCEIENVPLGRDYAHACGGDGTGGLAAALNARFDEWAAARRGEDLPAESLARYGTVDWLFRAYKSSRAYLERVSPRSRQDYERIMRLVCDHQTKDGGRLGALMVSAISPAAADKLYARLIAGPKGERLRQGEKVVTIAAKAWDIVHRLYPDCFRPDVANPWKGVTVKSRAKAIKAAVTRDDVYAFAWAAIELGRPEPAAAAVICFEWLQRPENVLAGYIRWTDYRGPQWPAAIKVEHHKTGAEVLHPLEGADAAGDLVRYYAEAEAVLAALPRRGVPMILKARADGQTEPFTAQQMAKLVRKLRDRIDGIPDHFTLDACRHGGMTELEEAGLTDGQGRALSAHRSRAYERYAKRTFDRALAATRKRHAHRAAGAAS